MYLQAQKSKIVFNKRTNPLYQEETLLFARHKTNRLTPGIIIEESIIFLHLAGPQMQ